MSKIKRFLQGVFGLKLNRKKQKNHGFEKNKIQEFRLVLLTVLKKSQRKVTVF